MTLIVITIYVESIFFSAKVQVKSIMLYFDAHLTEIDGLSWAYESTFSSLSLSIF